MNYHKVTCLLFLLDLDFHLMSIMHVAIENKQISNIYT